MAPSLRALVLAAGSGRRLAALTGGVPKQFWAPAGHRSMLDATLDRLDGLVPARRRVTVVSRQHLAYVRAVRGRARLGRIVDQPGDRGTAAGVLLGLTAMEDGNHDDVVVLTPSDHGINDVAAFQSSIGMAAASVRAGLFDLVLFGAEPDGPVVDYGWILPADGPTPTRHAVVRPVSRFVEKPAADEARRLLVAGGVWSTMVVVARLGALRALFIRCAPRLVEAFAAAARGPRACRRAAFDSSYAGLDPVDFSRDVLARAEHAGVALWPAAVGWSDLGTADRLEAWLLARPEAEAPTWADTLRQPA